MDRLSDTLKYLFHKAQKKLRLSAVRESRLHATARLESGTSFVASSLGRYSFCGYDCEVFQTDIGAFCSIANGVVIGGGEHPVDWSSTSPVFYNNVDTIKTKFSRHERIRPPRTGIGNDVWIGRNALIKQGVEIGTGAVIGMGAVVTRNVEPYAVVAGNPARVIRMRFDLETIKLLLDSKWWEQDDTSLEMAASAVRDPEEFINRLTKS